MENSAKKQNPALRVLKKNWGGWLIMLPSLLLFALFIWYPLIESLLLSFYRTEAIIEKVQFVGLANFRYVLTAPLFLTALRNTFFYTLWSVVIGFFLPIGAALVLSEVIHGKTLFKVLIYLPNVIPGMAVSIMWRYILTNESAGLLNMLFGTFGLGPFNYLGTSASAIPMIILSMTWRGAGATALIYLASLQSVDKTYYEAARLDGAGLIQRLWHVTVPHLMPLIRMLFILQIISVFQVFYEPMMIVGNSSSVVTLMQLNFLYAFNDYKGEYAAVLGMLITAFLVALSLVYMRLSRGKSNG